MEFFKAVLRNLDYSNYKLRPIADAIRGKSAQWAVGFLSTAANQRTRPVKKLLVSAIANAKDRKNVGIDKLVVYEIRVDQGPIVKYFKPGAQGRSMPQRKRSSHMSIILKSND